MQFQSAILRILHEKTAPKDDLFWTSYLSKVSYRKLSEFAHSYYVVESWVCKRGKQLLLLLSAFFRQLCSGIVFLNKADICLSCWLKLAGGLVWLSILSL